MFQLMATSERRVNHFVIVLFIITKEKTESANERY